MLMFVISRLYTNSPMRHMSNDELVQPWVGFIQNHILMTMTSTSSNLKHVQARGSLLLQHIFWCYSSSSSFFFSFFFTTARFVIWPGLFLRTLENWSWRGFFGAARSEESRPMRHVLPQSSSLFFVKWHTLLF